MESMRDINRVMEREIAKGSCLWVILFFTGYFFENIVHCILYENLHEKICMQTKICRQIKIYIPQKICMKMRIRKYDGKVLSG